MKSVKESNKQMEVTNTKPVIMLIPDSICWILGTWAKEIVKWNSDKCDFVIFPMGEIGENRKLFLSVLRDVNVVHCLTQWGFASVKQAMDNKSNHITLISTVHHIVEFSQVETCLDANRIMVVCNKYLNDLVSRGVHREKLFLIYNGVNTDFFSPKDKKESRKKLGLNPEGFMIGFSAKATSDHDGRKGIDIFIKVLSQLSQDMGSLIHVVLTGPGWNDVVKSLSSNNINIHYFPYLPEKKMPLFYNALDIYLITARVEGGPVPLLEAMSCGTPVITTPVGTVLDFVEDRLNGLVVPIGNVDRTVRAIQEMYENNELHGKIGLAGRETILKNLQWKDTVSKLGNVYGNLINREVIVNKRKVKLYSFSKLNSQLMKRDIKRWNSLIMQEPKQSLPKRMYQSILQRIRASI